MKLFIIIIISLLIISSSHLFAQNEQVREYLQMVADGQIDEVKRQLPDLLAAYPDDPGVQLLHGVVIEDGFKAVEKYENIITNYPKSEWADDAYWRIVQFYAIIGDTTQAKLHLNNYRKKYPASEFLIPASDAVKTAVFQNRRGIKARSYDQVDLTEKEEPAIIENEEIAEDVMEETPIHTDMGKNEEAPVKHEQVMNKQFGLQVGIYSTYEAAKSEVDRFQAMRMLAEIKQKKLGAETMYAVVIGDYSTKLSAENAKHIVQQQCKCVPIIFEK